MSRSKGTMTYNDRTNKICSRVPGQNLRSHLEVSHNRNESVLVGIRAYILFYVYKLLVLINRKIHRISISQKSRLSTGRLTLEFSSAKSNEWDADLVIDSQSARVRKVSINSTVIISETHIVGVMNLRRERMGSKRFRKGNHFRLQETVSWDIINYMMSIAMIKNLKGWRPWSWEGKKTERLLTLGGFICRQTTYSRHPLNLSESLLF